MKSHNNPNNPNDLIVRLATTLAVIVLIAVLGFNFGPQLTSGGATVSLQSNAAATRSRVTLKQHADPQKVVRIVLGLNLRNEEELDALLARQYNAQSPDYRRFLSVEEFTQRFSPSQEDYEALKVFLESQGLTVIESKNRLLIAAEGNLGQMEQAFKVRLNVYKRSNGEEGIINETEPQIPQRFQGKVRCLMGMNTFARHRSLTRFSARQQFDPPGMSPQKIATAYHFPNSNNQKPDLEVVCTGKGQTIAIATAYTYKRSDVDAYWSHYGIERTGTIENIPVAGVTDELNAETTLDLQQVGAQAPGAHILMYQGHDPSFGTFCEVFNRIVDDNRAKVISVSWGLCEREMGTEPMETEHMIFKAAAAQGIAIFAASGDNGAYDCGDRPPSFMVDYPSSDPYVTAVGGTRLLVKSEDDYSRALEVCWTGGGGGVSPTWKALAWQGEATADAQRKTPDVSLLSDPRPGYTVYYKGKWHCAGGTSFAAPNMAALWLLICEYTDSRVGGANELLYRLGRSGGYVDVFFDVTAGDNGDECGPGFAAGTGWDNATGWGAPNGESLMLWIWLDQLDRSASEQPQTGAVRTPARSLLR